MRGNTTDGHNQAGGLPARGATPCGEHRPGLSVHPGAALSAPALSGHRRMPGGLPVAGPGGGSGSGLRGRDPEHGPGLPAFAAALAGPGAESGAVAADSAAVVAHPGDSAV